MTKNKQVLVSLMRAFFGDLGVDSFLMKKVTEGVCRAAWFVVLCIASVACLVLFFTNGGVGLLIIKILSIVLLVVRTLLYFIGGLLMLKSSQEEFEDTYK